MLCVWLLVWATPIALLLCRRGAVCVRQAGEARRKQFVCREGSSEECESKLLWVSRGGSRRLSPLLIFLQYPSFEENKVGTGNLIPLLLFLTSPVGGPPLV